jgi:hypothetical protein
MDEAGISRIYTCIQSFSQAGPGVAAKAFLTRPGPVNIHGRIRPVVAERMSFSRLARM